MKQKFIKINIAKSLYLSIFLISKFIYCQPPLPIGYEPSSSNENCKTKGERSHPKSFSDCNTESTSTQVCCFLQGTNNGEKYEGCIAMDMEMFSNRTVFYNDKKFSGTLICDVNYNSNFYFNFTYLFYFCLLLLMVFF